MTDLHYKDLVLTGLLGFLPLLPSLSSHAVVRNSSEHGVLALVLGAKHLIQLLTDADKSSATTQLLQLTMIRYIYHQMSQKKKY